jgi:hypothetical protein
MEQIIYYNIRRGMLYIVFFFSFFSVVFVGCGKDKIELSPQSQKECLELAIFEDPSNSPYCLPFAADSSYLMTQSYCSGSSRSHNSRFAYDFKMPFGTEIIAARAGEVVEYRENFSDSNTLGGQENMVSLQHNDGTISLYIHMMQNGVDVELGEYVPKGGHLGWIGSSGTGFPHLHFQICERSGRCSWPDQEFTLPVNFRNAEGELDSIGGLKEGVVYKAGPCE